MGIFYQKCILLPDMSGMEAYYYTINNKIIHFGELIVLVVVLTETSIRSSLSS